MKNQFAAVSFLMVSILSLPTFGRDQSDPTMYTATSSKSVTSTTVPGDTIQSVALQAAGNSNRGKSLANAAIGVTTGGVMATCSNPLTASACEYWVAGLAASMAVRMFMSNASDTSDEAAKKVTTNDVQNNTDNTIKGLEKTNSSTDYNKDPDFINGNKVLTDLKNKGWKVDVASGKITTPSGKSYNASVTNSASSMRASGASESTIKAFQDAIAKVPAIAAEKAKASDAGASAYADDGGSGAGGAKAAVSVAGVSEGVGTYGNQLYSNNGSTIDRDPAQVAGMAKDFNGSKIGVAADGLFDMITRRYVVHKKSGSFIGSPSN